MSVNVYVFFVTGHATIVKKTFVKKLSVQQNDVKRHLHSYLTPCLLQNLTDQFLKFIII